MAMSIVEGSDEVEVHWTVKLDEVTMVASLVGNVTLIAVVSVSFLRALY